ncbi:MAG: hypothetical protein AMXMBFR64_19150 [Myxococcales bacterium]
MLTLVLAAPAAAQKAPSRSKFYDFTGQTIEADRRTPGLTVIFGDAYGRSVCQEDDVKAWRRCIGEVEDVFPGRDPSQRPIDFVVVLLGGSPAAVTFTSEVGGLAAVLRSRQMNARFVLVPAGEIVEDGKPVAVAHVDQTEHGFFDRLRLGVSSAGRKPEPSGGLDEVRRLFTPTDPKTYVREARGGLPISELLRPDSFVALVVVAMDGATTGDAARLARTLDETVQHSGWGAYVLCGRSTCEALRPLAVHPGDLMLPAESAGSGRLLKQAAEGAAWRLDRHLLSEPPTISGYLEVLAGESRLEDTLWSYDPFERRIRLATEAYDPSGRPVEAWYFPFNPLHVLAQMCPEATRPRTGTADMPSDGVRPCQGWAADEVVGPRPAPRIDVRWVPDVSAPDKQALDEAMAAFRAPFQKAEVDLFMSSGSPTPWRSNAFHVAITSRPGLLVDGADAQFAWTGEVERRTFEALAWRAINRSVRIPITGVPIFNTFKVFLNGREIPISSGDGAGYVLKAGGMHLDVAAPLHPESHIFLSYKLDAKQGGKRGGAR